ncbi:MAG TPA: hypothetical protein VGQ91_02105, partial [Ideonella sp.]|nr:hypothetical protein [Ideonella sp.]
MASASTVLRRSACALALIAGLHVQAASPALPETARPNIGALLNEAQALVTAGQGEQALQRLQAADSLGPLNAYEAFMAQRLRAAAALQRGDLAAAQAALQAVLATNRLDAAEALQTMSALGQTLYRAKDYAAAASWLQRYADAGGSQADVLALRAPARYFARDYAGARELLLATAKADAEALRATPLATWRMLAGTQRQLGDESGYRQALRGMAVQYPQPALWAELVQRELGEPSAWPERQLLDVQRLLRAAGALSDADAALALAEQA